MTRQSNDFPRHGKLHDEKRSGEDGRMLGLRSIEVFQVECRLSPQFLQAKVGGLSHWSWRETTCLMSVLFKRTFRCRLQIM